MTHSPSRPDDISSDPAAGARSLEDAEPAKSLFDDANFFETVVLGLLPPGTTGVHEELPIANGEQERQRLVRQAVQIARQLKHRQEDLDRREAAIEAAAAIFSNEQRVWRLTIQEKNSELQAKHEALEARTEELNQRTRELAAWEAGTSNELQQEQDRLATLERNLLQRENEFAQQVRARQLLQHQRDRDLQVARESLEQQDRTLQAVQQRVAVGETKISDRTKILGEADARLKQAHQQLQEFFEAVESRVDAVAQDAGPMIHESPSESSPERSDEQLLSNAGHVERLTHLGTVIQQLVQEVQTQLLGVLEGRLVDAELHEHLCQVCEPQEMARLSSELRNRLRAAMANVGRTLDEYRHEVRQSQTELEQSLAQLTVRERGMFKKLRIELGRIKQTWLQLDPPQKQQGPHWKVSHEKANTRALKSDAGAKISETC